MPVKTSVGTGTLEASAPDIQAASDHSILITFGNTIAVSHHHHVRGLFRTLTRQPIDGITNLHPAYSSLLISFDPRRVSDGELRTVISSRLAESISAVEVEEPLIEIPVCYERQFAPDLAEVARLHNMRSSEVVSIHSGTTYRVYFLGFSPGFPYLGDLPPELATPRLPTPRLKVPAGSVAIGGNQTGIYPIESPGGWRIIGRTPRSLFHPQDNPPTLLQMGTFIRFVPITRTEFEDILRQEER